MTTMHVNDLTAMIMELKELESMKKELEANIDAIQDNLKAMCLDADDNTIETTVGTISYKPVTSTKLDTTALKKALPELAERFAKTTTVRRFLVR